MLRNILVFLSTTILFQPLAFSADVYKTVDKNGQIIYTDKPIGSHSEKVDIGEPIVVPSVVPISRPSRNSSRTLAPPTHYTITIDEPAAETHINPGVFNLQIKVSTTPTVHDSHQLVILDNGSALPSALIEFIAPGSHHLQAQVINERGKVISSSAPVMVYVHRPNINNRPPPPGSNSTQQ